MTRTEFLLAASVALALTAMHPSRAHAQAAVPAAEREMTVAGARAAEEHWDRAELDGETGYLDDLLLPEYRSVGGNGSVHPKAAIIAGAKKNAANRDAAAAAADSFRKAHPTRTDVALHGNTAVVTFVSLVPASHEAIRGADILVFVDGRWHALYSAHSSAQ